MLGRAFDVRAVSRIVATCYLLNKTSAAHFQQCSMGSMTEYNLRSTAAATHNPQDDDDDDAIPPSVLTQWTQLLHAARNNVQVDSATLHWLYGKGATPSLMGPLSATCPQTHGKHHMAGQA
ncbi:hypothetical protein CYMTET_9725 [Cymbomonas tetramitiformis]|uniref:Uncharacterized protein n=1 Tax=Cymbomonas tetramitiformis TaxID=36881 RepID=A0AAE0LEK0_9CHLO|nr:hypothetical protein CYMTET_9725 [Cymbomonas tetramitiformis]